MCENIVTLSNITPVFTSIKYKDKELKPVFNERTSKFLFEYYILKVFINYIDLAESDGILAKKAVIQKVTTEELVTVEFLDDLTSRNDYEETSSTQNIALIKGNKKELKNKVSNLLIVFLKAIEEHKNVTNYSYENILDRVFKIKEREKNNITSRLQGMNDEEREADTILKINKLGLWSKGLQKGLTSYVKDNFDEEREDMEKMIQYERNLANHNKKTGQNLDMEQFMEDIIDSNNVNDEIDDENLNMEGYTGDDGNYYEDDNENEYDFDS
jgi:hypothetical protein